MTLTTNVDAIKDFQMCALLHDYRYRQKLPEPAIARNLMLTRYENTLKHVANFFFYKKQAGTTPSYNSLLNRWERLWFPKDMTAYDLAVEQHEGWHGNYASYSNEAVACLLKFYEDFSEINADPIMIDEKFIVPLTKTIRLEGSVDLVLRKKNENLVVKWSGARKRPSKGSLLLDYAALEWAFRYRTSQRASKFSLYDIGSSNPGFTEINPTSQDFQALLFWARELESTNFFVPRRGLTAYCRTCPFDSPCSEWNDWGLASGAAHEE